MCPQLNFLLAGSPKMLTTTPKICNKTGSVKKGSLSGKRQPY